MSKVRGKSYLSFYVRFSQQNNLSVQRYHSGLSDASLCRTVSTKWSKRDEGRGQLLQSHWRYVYREGGGCWNRPIGWYKPPSLANQQQGEHRGVRGIYITQSTDLGVGKQFTV